jgi:rhodanese-related sulfurtransferase
LSGSPDALKPNQNQQNHIMKKAFAFLAAAFLAIPAFAGEYPDISIAELKTAIAEKKVAVIDVNGADSYAKGHVPTAIDYSSEAKDLASKLPADKGALVVAYCGGPSCSAYTKAANAAKALGYTNVKHLSAGISGWMQAGEATEKK